MIFGEVAAFTSLIERIFKIRKEKNKNERKKEELISTRFINICNAHGVHRNQIPRLFNTNLSLYDVQSDQHLLKKLDDDMLVKACELFGINRDWLDGISPQIYPTYDFYKKPNEFRKFLNNLLNKSPDKIDGVLLSPKQGWKQHAALLLLQETVGYIGDSPIYRYYLCNNWIFSYWKTRAYLTTCIAQCWKNKIYVIGRTLPHEFIDSVESGEKILSFDGRGIYGFSGSRWYAEDMTTSPDVFLNGIDPEMDKFGYRAGLELWLELDSDGFMNSRMQNANTRSLFISELEKYD